MAWSKIRNSPNDYPLITSILWKPNSTNIGIKIIVYILIPDKNFFLGDF